MSFHPRKNTRVTSGARKMPSMANSGAKHEKMGKNQYQPHHTHNADSENSMPKTLGANEEGGISSKTEGGDGGDTDGNGAEMDELGEDDGDEDGIAPSGCTIGEDGKQAGHTNEKSNQQPNGTREKRKRHTDSLDDKPKPTKALKRTRGTKGSDGNSDDDDYAGVDLISDSEEEEPRVEQLEERMIIDSEEEYTKTMESMIMPSTYLNDSCDDWGGFDLTHGLFLSDVAYFDEQIGRSDPATLADEIEIFNATSFFDEIAPPPRIAQEQRRVRFVEPIIPSCERSNTASPNLDEEMEPELILRLPFKHRCRAERYNGNSESCHIKVEDGSEGSCGNSSGYETDQGETTEEDELPPSVTATPQSLLRRSPTSYENIGGTQTPAPASNSATSSAGRRWGPRMGSWIADPTKPIVITDRTGKTLIIYPAQRPKASKKFGQVTSSGSSTADTSPRVIAPKLATTFTNSVHSNFLSQEPGRYHTRHEPNVMMSGLLPGNMGLEHLFRGEVLGSPEAFCPGQDSGADYATKNEKGDVDDEDLWDVSDFINFGEESEETEIEQTKSVHSMTAEPASPQSPQSPLSVPVNPQTLIPTDSSARTFLDRLGKGVLTSFRRSQYHIEPQHHPQDSLFMRRRESLNRAGRNGIAGNPSSPIRKRGSIINSSNAKSLGLPALGSKKRHQNPR